MTRTDRASAVRAGAYTLQPSVRVHDDGSVSLLYWTAVNRAMKRAEFIVGPESLESFKRNVGSFENAGATAYMHGEPNAWQRLSLKTVDDATRRGPMAAMGALKSAWSAAVRDPSWWGQNLLAASTAVAGAGTFSRGDVAAAEESAAARTARAPTPTTPGRHTPIAEGGGLRAHEGGAARGHLIERHVGKAPAELEARFATSKRLDQSSSFYNRAQAEAGAAKALAANEREIAAWLADKTGKSARLRLEYHPVGPSFPVGLHMERGAGAVPVAGVRLVLIKDASTSTGFRILTGFPIP